MRSLTVLFLLLNVLAAIADVRIPLFGGSITIFNNSDGSYTVATEKKTAENGERRANFMIRNGTVENYDFSTNETATTAPPKLRVSEQRPKSAVLNALLSMFGRF